MVSQGIGGDQGDGHRRQITTETIPAAMYGQLLDTAVRLRKAPVVIRIGSGGPACRHRRQALADVPGGRANAQWPVYAAGNGQDMHRRHPMSVPTVGSQETARKAQDRTVSSR